MAYTSDIVYQSASGSNRSIIGCRQYNSMNMIAKLSGSILLNLEDCIRFCVYKGFAYTKVLRIHELRATLTLSWLFSFVSKCLNACELNLLQRLIPIRRTHKSTRVNQETTWNYGVIPSFVNFFKESDYHHNKILHQV